MRAIDTDLVNAAVESYVAGKTLKQVEQETGVSASVTSGALRARGIKARSRRIELPVGELVQLYASGSSELELGRRYGVARHVVGRVLTEHGVARRGRSSAQSVRQELLGAEGRAALTAAAHAANWGRVAPDDEKIRSARTRQDRPKAPSVHEASFAEMLTQRGIAYQRETAIGIWNIDFTVGRIAIEILGGEWHASSNKADRHSRRTPEILAAGWTLVFIWSTPTFPMGDQSAEYVATLNAAESTSGGTYHVLRGDGVVIGSGQAADFVRDGLPPARLALLPRQGGGA